MKIIKLPKEKKYFKGLIKSGSFSFPMELTTIPKDVLEKLFAYIQEALNQRVAKENHKVDTIRISHIGISYTTRLVEKKEGK